MKKPMIRVFVLISGQVQGVSFRYWTVKEATQRNLTGWVRNRPDGKVEAIFEGAEAVVRDMIEACRAGPRSAQVARVETTEEPFLGEFSDFSVQG